MAGVDEQLGRRHRDEDVRLAGVHTDVATTMPLVPQHLGELRRVRERLPEYQSTPAHFDDHVVGHRVDQVLRRRVVQAERDRFGAVGVQGGHAADPVDAVLLQPQFEQSELPELVAAQRGQATVRVGQQPVDGLRPEQAALLGRRRVEGVAHQIEVRPFEMRQRRHREVALGAVDDLRGDHLPGGLLEHALAVMCDLQLGRAGGRQFDEFVIEERHPAFQTPGHRHVVDALDRVVHQHHRGIEAQRPVDSGLGAVPGEVVGDELLAQIALGEVVLRDEPCDACGVAVEERLAVVGDRAVQRCRVGHRRIPVVAREHLVGALPGLHHLDVLGHFLAEQIEGDAVVADHRLAHGADRTVQCGQHAVGADADLMVIGAETLGDDVGVLELVARHAAHRLEADGESRQSVLARFGEQPDDQAGVDSAGQQTSDGHVGDQAALDRDPQ